MDTVLAEAPIVIHPNDTEPLKFPFTKAIPASGATISSPSIAVSPSGELAFTSVAVNSEAFNTKHDGTGDDIPAEHAVVATPGSQEADSDYEVTVTVTVTDADANTWSKAGVWIVKCRDNE